jgi:hypothetical protein
MVIIILTLPQKLNGKNINKIMDKDEKKLNKKEGEIIELHKFYKKLFELPPKPREETLEDKIERVNPYYTRNKSINYVGE